MQHQHHQQHPPYYATKPPTALFVSPQLYSAAAATALWNHPHPHSHPQPPQLLPEDDQLDDDEEDSDMSSDEQGGVYDDVIEVEEDDDESSSAHTNFSQLPSALHTAVPDPNQATTTGNATQRVEDLFEDVARAYAEMVCWLWFSHPTDHFNPTNLQRQLQPTDHFVEWLRRVITMTQLSSTVVILSLHYLTKLKKPRNAPGSINTHSNLFDSVNPSRGSEYLVAVVALMLANKVMDDNTYTNKSWAWMCGANLEQINAAEREFLVATRHELHVDQNMLSAWKYVLLGHMKARASRVASVQAISGQPQARSTQSQPRQPILRARSVSPEPGLFTFTVALPRRAPANPPARRTARPTSCIGPQPPTQHWLLPEASSSRSSSTGVKRSAEAAFSPRSLAAPILAHPNERVRHAAAQVASAAPAPIPPARRVYASAVSRRAPRSSAVAPHPPAVEFHFSQMTLNGSSGSSSNHGTPLYPTPTPPVPNSPAPVPQLAMPHVPATLSSLDAYAAPPLQFYQLVQGGRILRAATPAGGRSFTAAQQQQQQQQLAVRIPTDHYRFPAPAAGPSPERRRCEAPGCKSHTNWSSQLRTEQPLSAASDASMQLYPPQHQISKFATPSPQTHMTLPPCRTLLHPSAGNSPMSVYPSPQAQAYPYSRQGASPALVAEYAQFANAGSPGFHWASAPSSSSTVYRERPSSGVLYSLASPLTHHMLYSNQSAYPTRAMAITPLQQYALKQQQPQQQQPAPRTVPYEYTVLPQQQQQHQSATSRTQPFRSPVGYL